MKRLLQTEHTLIEVGKTWYTLYGDIIIITKQLDSMRREIITNEEKKNKRK